MWLCKFNNPHGSHIDLLTILALLWILFPFFRLLACVYAMCTALINSSAVLIHHTVGRSRHQHSTGCCSPVLLVLWVHQSPMNFINTNNRKDMHIMRLWFDLDCITTYKNPRIWFVTDEASILPLIFTIATASDDAKKLTETQQHDISTHSTYRINLS